LAAFGAPIPNFGGGVVLKNPAVAERPAWCRALIQSHSALPDNQLYCSAEVAVFVTEAT